MKRSGHAVAVCEQLPPVTLRVGEKGVLVTSAVKGQDGHKGSLRSATDRPDATTPGAGRTDGAGCQAPPDSLRECP